MKLLEDDLLICYSDQVELWTLKPDSEQENTGLKVELRHKKYLYDEKNI
jgi:hypothetical protein